MFCLVDGVGLFYTCMCDMLTYFIIVFYRSSDIRFINFHMNEIKYHRIYPAGPDFSGGWWGWLCVKHQFLF